MSREISYALDRPRYHLKYQAEENHEDCSPACISVAASQLRSHRVFACAIDRHNRFIFPRLDAMPDLCSDSYVLCANASGSVSARTACRPGRAFLSLPAVSVVVVGTAAVSLLLVVRETDAHPRTDDATVRANFIEIVAEVSGRLVNLPVKDNALVKKGDLLFAIDPRPYEY